MSDRQDSGIASLLLLLTASAAWLTAHLQEITFGDGILYLQMVRQGDLYAHHHLYLPGMVAFTKGVGLIGIDDRAAGFLFSTFMVLVGNAFLWLTIRDRGGRWPTLFVLLATSSAVVTFFGTTAENHGQHYAWVCLALWSFAVAVGRGGWLAWLAAGLALACVPASHLTGFMLVPAMALAALLRGGLPRTAVYLVPLAVYAVLFHLTTWFRADVLELRPDLIASPIGFEIDSKILTPGLDPRRWPGYLWNAWLVPAFGCWLALAAALPWLWRHARASAVIAVFGMLPYLVLLPMHSYPERGAYFLALVPWAVLATSLASRNAPRGLAWVLAAVIVVQGAWASWSLAGHPTESHTDAKGFAQLWAQDAISVEAKVPPERRLYLCTELWRKTHLEYDHRAGVLRLKPALADVGAAHKAKTLEAFATELPNYIKQGAVFVTEELWQQLPKLWPELRAVLEKAFRVKQIRHGRFVGRRVVER